MAAPTVKRKSLRLEHRDWDAYLRRNAIRALVRGVSRPGTLLDVGCGGDALAGSVGRDVVGVDLVFGAVDTRGFAPVRASGLCLPFADRAFPVVVCSDVLEHLSLDERTRVIRELVRVTGETLIVSFPSGERAKEQDVIVKNLLLTRGTEVPSWLNEHLRQRYPAPDDVIRIVRQIDPHASTSVHDNFNRRLRKYYYRLATAGSEPYLRITRLLLSNIVRVLPSFCSLGGCYRKVVIVSRNNIPSSDQ